MLRPIRFVRRVLALVLPLALVLALVLPLALVLVLAPAARAQDANDLSGGDFDKGGRTAMQFLKIGVGARQAALGEASVALVRDATAAFWNPAGIVGIARYEAAFSYTRWLADMNMMAAVVGGRVGGVGTFALSLAALDYGDIPEAVLNGQPDPRTGNSVSGGDFLVGLSYARYFTDRLSIGVGAKYLHETLWDYAAGTFAFDVGTNYEVGYRGLRLAMAAQNFAGSVNWLNEDETDRVEGYDLPLVFRVGLSGNLAGENGFIGLGGPHRVTGTVEAINTNDYGERLHVGAEYVFDELFALRGGYRLNYAEGNWAVGAGLSPRLGAVQARIDYAYVGYEFLAAPHRLTVALAF